MLFKNTKKHKRKGDIGTVFAAMIAILIISVSFTMYMTLNIDTMKYQNMSQYARDSLLVLETNGTIQKTYMADVKQKLSSKLNMKTGETLNVYIQVGTGTKYEVNSMPTTITTDYGENINVQFVYTYKKKTFGVKTNSLGPTVTTANETMSVDLSTISKNRRISDG